MRKSSSSSPRPKALDNHLSNTAAAALRQRSKGVASRSNTALTKRSGAAFSSKGLQAAAAAQATAAAACAAAAATCAIAAGPNNPCSMESDAKLTGQFGIQLQHPALPAAAAAAAGGYNPVKMEPGILQQQQQRLTARLLPGMPTVPTAAAQLPPCRSRPPG